MGRLAELKKGTEKCKKVRDVPTKRKEIDR